MPFEKFQVTEEIVYANFFSRNFHFFCNPLAVLTFTIATEVSPFDVPKIYLLRLRTLRMVSFYKVLKCFGEYCISSNKRPVYLISELLQQDQFWIFLSSNHLHIKRLNHLL